MRGRRKKRHNTVAFYKKRRFILVGLVFVALLLLISWMVVVSDDDLTMNEQNVVEQSSPNELEDNTQDQSESSDQPIAPAPTPEDPDETSSESSTQLPLLVLVNKRTPIEPINYSPQNLISPDVSKRSGATVDARVAPALEKMFAEASDDGVTLVLSNGFRSYGTQRSLYNSYVSQDGQAAADTYSARPGHSEHQTGLSVDITTSSGACHLQACFGDLTEGQWLANNAYRFGFIIRYTQTNKTEAGYTYEPWHLRYIGESEAEKYVSENASSLESYLGQSPAPDYL